MLLLCGAVCRGEVWEGTMPLAWLSAGFHSLPLLHTSKLGPSCAVSQVGGFVYILGPCGSLQWTLLWGCSFSHNRNPHRFVLLQVLRLCFSMLEPWVVQYISLPSCSSQFIHMQIWDHKVCWPLPCLFWSSSCCLAAHPLCPHCLSPPLLPVWINVSSLTPWLLDFHTIWFSGSSGYFLFLNLLLFFF